MLFRRSNLKKENPEVFDMITDIKNKIKSGVPEYEIRLKTESDLMKMHPFYGEKIAKYYADKFVLIAKKELKDGEKIIQFSKEEFKFIDTSFVDEADRLCMFVLMCLSKYYGGKFDMKTSELENECHLKKGTVDIRKYVDNDPDKKLFCHSAVRDKRFFYYPSPYIEGLFNPDNTCLTISNFYSIFYYYDYYHNPEKYLFCKRCGRILPKKKQEKYGGNNQTYCYKCAKIVNKENMNSINRLHEDWQLITCSKCGKEFRIGPKSKKTLCGRCYAEKRREDKTLCMQNLRENKR
nr:MAG TPA: zinc-ribbon family protein [Caudoviricetes sp.]